MTQEHIMKRRMIRTIFMWLITFVALLVFIGLYIDETKKVQETYREQFRTNLNHASDSISSYLDGDGDFQTRYFRILNDMSSANSFSFLMDSNNITEEHKIAINELHTCLIKYPEQMQEKERLEALKQAVDDMYANLDKGFDEAEELVETINKKGN